MDKTWVHHFTRDKVTIEALETPRFSTFQWRSAGKVMASIFWDAEGVLLVDSQDKGHTIIWAYYAEFFLNSYGWKSSRFDLESWQEECSFTRTVHRHTGPQWPWLLSRNMDSNLSKTHPILLIWLLSLPENEIGARWSSFCQRWWCYECCGPLYEVPKWHFLHRKDLSAPWPLE